MTDFIDYVDSLATKEECDAEIDIQKAKKPPVRVAKNAVLNSIQDEVDEIARFDMEMSLIKTRLKMLWARRKEVPKE